MINDNLSCFIYLVVGKNIAFLLYSTQNTSERENVITVTEISIHLFYTFCG